MLLRAPPPAVSRTLRLGRVWGIKMVALQRDLGEIRANPDRAATKSLSDHVSVGRRGEMKPHARRTATTAGGGEILAFPRTRAVGSSRGEGEPRNLKQVAKKTRVDLSVFRADFPQEAQVHLKVVEPRSALSATSCGPKRREKRRGGIQERPTEA